jgi:hypothetical protein
MKRFTKKFPKMERKEKVPEKRKSSLIKTKKVLIFFTISGNKLFTKVRLSASCIRQMSQ